MSGVRVAAGDRAQVDPVDQRRATSGPRGVVGVEVDRALGVRPAKPPVRRTRTSRSSAVGRWRLARRRRCRPPGVDADGAPRPRATASACSPAAATVAAAKPAKSVSAPTCAAGERGVPDPAGALPRRAADRGGGEVEGAVGDAGVEVDAAVVVGGLDVVVHVADLRVLAERRVVVRRAGVRPCRAAPRAWTPGRKSPAPISQSRLVGGLAEQPLLEAGARRRRRPTR